jgi:hypothetical protein
MSGIQELDISFPEGVETLRVSPVGPNCYRLEDSSFVGDVFYGDVIELVHQSDTTNAFVRVASRSGLEVRTAILTPAMLHAPGLQSFLDRIVALGGNWERAFGGFLIIHTPPDAPVDVEREIRALVEK